KLSIFNFFHTLYFLVEREIFVKDWYKVSSLSCLKLWISSSCLAVFDGGQYLWIKAFLRRSQESTVPGGSLSTHRLAAPVRVMGKTHSMTTSCDTSGMLNKLTLSKTRFTCSWALSFGVDAVEDFKEYTLRDYYCWCKLKLLDNDADSILRLLEQSATVDDKMKK
nr:hypothetical protein [Tanacetum cinerariifolium]